MIRVNSLQRNKRNDYIFIVNKNISLKIKKENYAI